MPDRDKVIKGLETCIPMKYESNEEKECRHEQCPYGRENYKPMNGCFWDLMSDALAILKERKSEWEQISPAKIYKCKACGQQVITNDIECYKFCHGCGAKMSGVIEEKESIFTVINKLLPCKKCGYPTWRHLRYSPEAWRISCTYCEYCTKEKKTKEEAEEAWNQR